MTTWTQKLIELDVQANPGASTPSVPGPLLANGSVVIKGARSSVQVRSAGVAVGCEADVKVWGLSQSLMNQVTALGLAFSLTPLSTLTIKAGDGSGMTTIFQGTIYHAYGDYERAPDVPLILGCISGTGGNIAPAAPNSFQGSQNVDQIMNSLAGKMGMNFQNNGVSGAPLQNAYVEGTLLDQARQIAQHAGISWAIINGGTTLAICPRGGSFTPTGTVPIIAPPPLGAMISYPAFTRQGIIVKTIFDPRIQFQSKFQVRSSIPQANGEWVAYKIDHGLDSLVPHGQWMSTVYGYKEGQTQPLVKQ